MSKSQQRRWWGASGLIVLVLVVVIFRHHAPWKAFDWDAVWTSIAHARPQYLLLAVAATCATYIARAYRWKFFLDPLKKASVWNLFVAQILGFSTIYLIGRTGELVRPAFIARTEKVPFSSQIAILILERVYDSIAMVLLFALTLYFEPLYPATASAARSLRRLHHGAVVALILSCLLVAGLFLFRIYSDAVFDRLPGLLSWTPRRIREPLRGLIQSFSAGLDVIENFRDFLATALWTLALWLLNLGCFFFAIRSVKGSLAHFSWEEAGLALFFAAIGLMVQLPGVGGGYQVAVILALRELFSIPREEAFTAGILAGAVVMIPCMALGLALLFYEGLTWGKLKAMADDEKQALAAEQRASVGGSWK
jgi:uncharacterized protein (TIRG00374 family)